MAEADWQDPEARVLGVEFSHPDDATRMLLILNAGDDADFALPGSGWTLAFDSSGVLEAGPVPEGAVKLPWQSVLVLDRSAPAA